MNYRPSPTSKTAKAKIVLKITARRERRRLSRGHITAKNELRVRDNAQHLLGFSL
ncbi:hypothetical protein [Mycobacterium sp. M23085]|uniref:hypothetical protein n=1 Tax=Mycobacterium sp. M23085 TaxID=3378087 RepID=UPI003877E614